MRLNKEPLTFLIVKIPLVLFLDRTLATGVQYGIVTALELQFNQTVSYGYEC